MKTKERWISALKLEPVDRLPFWPKINTSYLLYQSDNFKNMPLEEIHRWIGSDRHEWLTDIIREKRKTTFLEEKKEKAIRKLIYGTRYGNLYATMKFDTSSQSWHPIEFPIKNKNDIKIMTEWFKDSSIELDTKKLKQAKEETRTIGSDAITAQSIGTSSLMVWVQHLASIENSHYFLTDYKDEVKELFYFMQKKLIRTTEIMVEYSPADILYLVENTSTTLISPQQYKKYCYEHILECAKIVKERERLLVLHMCGHLKSLLLSLSTLPVAGFEAFTSPPVGNTTLLDGRIACPDKCLIGGTNAVVWTKSSEDIITQIEKDLDKLPHHRGIVISSAGVMPPFCKPETIKKVCQWIKSYRIKN